MKRDIFVVNAYIVDANGTFNQLSGYPKAFDSKNYNNDIEKTKNRALAEYHDTLGALYKRDDRQVQYVEIIQTSVGMAMFRQKIGELADLPDPEPEEETEPEE